jgi:hypothetical protein
VPRPPLPCECATNAGHRRLRSVARRWHRLGRGDGHELRLDGCPGASSRRPVGHRFPVPWPGRLVLEGEDAAAGRCPASASRCPLASGRGLGLERWRIRSPGLVNSAPVRPRHLRQPGDGRWRRPVRIGLHPALAPRGARRATSGRHGPRAASPSRAGPSGAVPGLRVRPPRVVRPVPRVRDGRRSFALGTVPTDRRGSPGCPSGASSGVTPSPARRPAPPRRVAKPTAPAIIPARAARDPCRPLRHRPADDRRPPTRGSHPHPGDAGDRHGVRPRLPPPAHRPPGAVAAVVRDGNFSSYEADKKKRPGIAADQPHRIRYRKLTK